MTDLSTIPMDELRTNRQESHNDLVICTIAKIQSEEYYAGGTQKVDDRIDGNLRIIQNIDAEIKRREQLRT